MMSEAGQDAERVNRKRTHATLCQGVKVEAACSESAGHVAQPMPLAHIPPSSTSENCGGCRASPLDGGCESQVQGATGPPPAVPACSRAMSHCAWQRSDSQRSLEAQAAPTASTAPTASAAATASEAVEAEEAEEAKAEGEEEGEGEGEDEGGGNDSDDATEATDRAARVKDRARKPHLQGRFSGRLETKGDEKRLAEECRLLGPLLGGVGKRGERSRLTLAKIVRGIAGGEVRAHCEGRERELQDARGDIKRLRQDYEARIAELQGQMAALRAEVAAQQQAALPHATNAVKPEAQRAAPGPPHTVGLPAGHDMQHGCLHMQTQGSSSLPQMCRPLHLGLSQGMQLVAPAAPPAPPAAAQPDMAGSAGSTEAQALAQEAVHLQAQAENYKAHADHLAVACQRAPSQPAAVQTAVQAQSYQAKAQSLEKAAEAQSAQARACVHARCGAAAQAQAQELAAKAHCHARAQLHFAARADQLKLTQPGPGATAGASYLSDHWDSPQAPPSVAAATLQEQLEGHAHAQNALSHRAQTLAAKAQVYAAMQAAASAQAAAAAQEAHHLDAAAQQLQAEAHLVGTVATPAPPPLPSAPVSQPLLPPQGEGGDVLELGPAPGLAAAPQTQQAPLPGIVQPLAVPVPASLPMPQPALPPASVLVQPTTLYAAPLQAPVQPMHVLPAASQPGTDVTHHHAQVQAVAQQAALGPGSMPAQLAPVGLLLPAQPASYVPMAMQMPLPGAAASPPAHGNAAMLPLQDLGNGLAAGTELSLADPLQQAFAAHATLPRSPCGTQVLCGARPYMMVDSELAAAHLGEPVISLEKGLVQALSPSDCLLRRTPPLDGPHLVPPM